VYIARLFSPFFNCYEMKWKWVLSIILQSFIFFINCKYIYLLYVIKKILFTVHSSVHARIWWTVWIGFVTLQKHSYIVCDSCWGCMACPRYVWSSKVCIHMLGSAYDMIWYDGMCMIHWMYSTHHVLYRSVLYTCVPTQCTISHTHIHHNIPWHPEHELPISDSMHRVYGVYGSWYDRILPI